MRGSYVQLTAAEVIASVEDDRREAAMLREQADLIERRAHEALVRTLDLVDGIEDEERFLALAIGRQMVRRARSYAIDRGWDITKVAREYRAINSEWDAERAIKAAIKQSPDPIRAGYNR